jgi:hypothetical protein
MIMVISPNKRHLEQLARAQARGSEPAPEPEPEPEAVAEVESGPASEPVVTASETDEG